MKTFELKAEHILLIGNMYVGWQYTETGAPDIDPKRPYGNSDVIMDIHEILSAEILEDELPQELANYYMKIHKETEAALQIILYTKSFVPGFYHCEDYTKEWALSK